MNSQNKKTVMDQKIFKVGLSLEAVSVYMLCCSLADSDTTISTKNLLEIWTSTTEALTEGLKDLEKRNIVLRVISDRKENNIYKLTDANKWELD